MRNFLIGVLLFWFLVIGLILQDSRARESASMAGIGESGKDRVEVVFWHAMGGPLGNVMNDLIDRFNKSQPTYFIKGIPMGSYDTLAKKLLASLVAKSAPDIAQNYETLTKKFIKHRKIVCLDDLLASEPENIKADIIPVLLENNTFDGKLWSFPFNKSVPVLYYNKELFRQAGLDPEQPPQTLTELASYARQITRHFTPAQGGRPTVMGFATGKANVWMFLCRVMQFGGRLIAERGDTSHFHEPASVRAVSFIQEMLKEGIAVEAQGFDHQNDFKAQRVAMIENSIVSKVHMESGLKFEYGIAPLPGEATRAVILSGSNINIFNNGNPDKIKGAWEFIKWFTSTDIGAEWSVRTTYVPVRTSSLRSPVLVSALEKDPNLRAPYQELEYIAFEPRLSCWFEVRDLMADVLERATLEMGDPATYMKEMSSNIDGILRHNPD
ncbi:MAG TPA: ABC transporter substrate-binding protein [Candidatus Ozemobacteraceae bacterium]|nr:ABC transporter substrate-binding protein [Candidatus Ozemobacteraceae bacterium]